MRLDKPRPPAALRTLVGQFCCLGIEFMDCLPQQLLASWAESLNEVIIEERRSD